MQRLNKIPKPMWVFLALLCLVFLLQHCSPVPPQAESRTDGTNSPTLPAPEEGSLTKSRHNGTELDRMLDTKPITAPEIKAGSNSVNSGSNPNSALPVASNKTGPWRIQAGALPDLEAAQNRKRALEQKLGGTVDLSFDPPYYKLKWGAFANRPEAEDKLLELSDIIRDGFIVRQ